MASTPLSLLQLIYAFGLSCQATFACKPKALGMENVKPNPPTPGPRRTGSHSSLTQLTLSPLSSNTQHHDSPTVLNYDRDPDLHDSLPTAPSSYGGRNWTSYISNKSAPTTPSVLSRAPSTSHLVTHLTAKAAGGSKSSTHLALTSTGAPRRRARGQKRVGGQGEGGEWLFRAGAAISSGARESKGQAWLVSRDSSTSLAAGEDEEEAVGEIHDDAAVAARKQSAEARSTRASRAGSRVGSRVGSRMGSRADLAGLSMRKGRSMGDEDYFGCGALGEGGKSTGIMMEPDFVDKEKLQQAREESEDDLDDERMDEADVARLTTGNSGIGIGGLMGRLVGWTPFNMKDSDEPDDDGDNEMLARDERARKERARMLRGENDRIMAAPKDPNVETQKGAGNAEQPSGWSDAAWLLSVASKVLF